MDSKSLVDVINFSDIVTQKLHGIANKVEIVAVSNEDKQLARAINSVLKHQLSVSELIKQEQKTNESR